MHSARPVFAVRKKCALAACGLLCALSLLGGCASKSVPPTPQVPPPDPVSFESPEVFVKNLRPSGQELTTWREMAPTVRKSLNYTKRKPAHEIAVSRNGKSITWGKMTETLQSLLTLLPLLDEEPNLLLERFEWVNIGEGIAYSGYYEPVVNASPVRKPGYEHPIYSVPPDLASYKARHGGKYHTRKAIDGKKVLQGRGLELAWAADPVDVFFLEIQGSGRLKYEDGTQRYVNYAAQNNHKYKSSGKIMREKKLLTQGHIFEQRQWFKDNPHRVNEILHENNSYVFFKFGHRGPTGAMGHVVDDWLSLATDRKFIPLGSVVAYGVNIPDQENKVVPLRGIGFAQDVGGAIKRNRIDIFCGGDERANYVASHLDNKGPAWILLAK